MKILFKIILLSIIIHSCTKKKNNNYLTFSGKIKNKTCDSIIIKSFYKQKTKVIALAKDGSFRDTLKITKKTFQGLYIGEFWEKIYFKNGDNIHMTVDLSDFDKTLKFTGKGVEEIHFMRKFYNTLRILHEKKDIYNLPEADFNTTVNNDFSKLNESLLNDRPLDSTFVIKQSEIINTVLGNIKKAYQEEKLIKKTLTKGKTAPKFIDYINHKGGTSSLDDFKGKYVYIDIWATWCNPCIAELSNLQKLIEKYKEKNIQFMNISIDRKKDFDLWKSYVSENKLKGTQLIMSEDKSFKKAFRISDIPRYILIDPNGNIVNASAPFPSDPKLIELFNSLEI